MNEKKSIISELIELCKVDGHLSEPETALIKAMGNLIGMSDNEILEVFAHPAPFEPPKDHADRITQFHRLILLANIDLNFTEEERKHITFAGIKLGLSPGAIEEVLERMFDYDNRVIPTQDLVGIFKKHMN